MMTTDKEFKATTDYSGELTAGNLKKTMTDLGAKSNDLWKVRPSDIQILPGYNPRIRNDKYNQKIRWLADQMKEHGYYPDKPLAGYVAVEAGKQVIYLQDGHGRLEAALLAIKEGAPIETLPMVMKDRSMSQVDLTIALVTSNEGEPFGAMEKAALVKRFRAFDKTDTEIAAIMRCTPAYVGQLATLAGAPRKIRDMVADGEVSATNAIEMMRKHADGATDVLEAAVATAKAKGKGKASAKDDKASALVARQKQAGPELYRLIDLLMSDKANKFTGPASDELDSLMFKIENGPPKKEKPVKVPKVAKVKKVPTKKVAKK